MHYICLYSVCCMCMLYVKWEFEIWGDPHNMVFRSINSKLWNIFEQTFIDYFLFSCFIFFFDASLYSHPKFFFPLSLLFVCFFFIFEWYWVIHIWNTFKSQTVEKLSYLAGMMGWPPHSLFSREKIKVFYHHFRNPLQRLHAMQSDCGFGQVQSILMNAKLKRKKLQTPKKKIKWRHGQ